jgi:phosphopantothenoylcysteine decarboxylase / phosphopantothenate---cysteine ligase
MNILVTAGPTREAIDPVRFISNRSSGKMGYAIARAAAARKHKVVLISGPVSLKPPKNMRVMQVVTAAEMLKAVKENVRRCDVLVMAAAVADWRPKTVSARKLKKRNNIRKIEVEPTTDILSSVRNRKGKRLFVGFAAETGRLMEEACRKLKAKTLDLIIANDVSGSNAGFEVDTNKVTFLDANGEITDLPLMSKHAVARRLVAWIERKSGRT